ncbi:MAG: class I SAM-dependent methyltransferase [Spirochaetales bacterium]|nr:class I SAM-dependent methyltransferase [Spirochaetales bacterium]
MNKKPTDEAPEYGSCPLCAENRISLFFKDNTREYLLCRQCALIFVPSEYQLSAGEEKARYDLHQNNSEDEGYRSFLSRLSIPLLERLPPRQSGLDFGCGPGPVLSMMLEEEGHSMTLFDPYYRNNPEVLNRCYDFITATEVLEHLSAPGFELGRLLGMLRPGGYLGIMTKMATDLEAFSLWHYIQDDTHISFFSRQTFEYLAELHKVSLEFIENDVILMRKP